MVSGASYAIDLFGDYGFDDEQKVSAQTW